jgi:uncharacterized protein
MYENGWGVSKDDKEAAKWYRLAAAQGNAIAQNNLGTMYRDGHGVPQDAKEVSARCLTRSRDRAGQPRRYVPRRTGRSEKLCPRVYVVFHCKKMSEHELVVFLSMTPAKIELAEKMAKRCVESNYQQCGEPELVGRKEDSR